MTARRRARRSLIPFEVVGIIAAASAAVGQWWHTPRCKFCLQRQRDMELHLHIDHAEPPTVQEQR